ncbi:MAG: hypothetical protein RBT78_02740 [Kiritimatiellia bacterium]|jgi:hypothetical protein|nr:hypothetical protein [Kiritimatiellia bacterium]
MLNGLFKPFFRFAAFSLVLATAAAGEPPLPPGLAASAPRPPLPASSAPAALSEPALPAGLDMPSEPALPAGLGTGPDKPRPAFSRERLLPEGLSGFWELRGGARLQDDPREKAASLGETRLQLQLDRAGERAAIKVVGDFLYDPVLNKHDIRLEDGDGWLDLRQANLLLRPAPFLDLQLGRQISTWGTGDMLFINDLFPKDWNAYFIGRDDEYLKAPSDSAKASLFSGWVNLDLIYAPRFDSDRFVDGRRLSYWNGGLGRRAGRDATVDADKPDDAFRDDEWAARLYRTLGSYEIAAYGYDGFWKSPAGSDPQSGRAAFPRLQVFGASGRGPLAQGILSLETGWYRSADDLAGDDPRVRNSEIRYLVGYEQELARELTGGIQYYVEQMLDHGAYQRTLPDGMRTTDELRHVVTLRLTRLLMNQNLQLGAFLYFSPSDHDTYLRPKASYKIDDHWIAEIGGNLFFGEEDHTFFGQFERNNNLYASLRYGF